MSVIAALVTFATPYAIFIFQEYARSIPIELDESARIDRCHAAADLSAHLPTADGAGFGRGRHYALLLAWNDILYQFLCSPASKA